MEFKMEKKNPPSIKTGIRTHFLDFLKTSKAKLRPVSQGKCDVRCDSNEGRMIWQEKSRKLSPSRLCPSPA